MKGFVLAMCVLISSTIVLGEERWLKESDAKRESKKFQGCKACRGAGYAWKTVTIGDPRYNLAPYYPKESKRNHKKIYVQCESCMTALKDEWKKQVEEKKKQIEEKKIEQTIKHEADQKKVYARFNAISASLIGAVDEIAPKQLYRGTLSEWCLDYKGREKDKDYGWTPDVAKLMPARCPIVFQVINSKSFLVKSQINGTLVILDTINDYEVPDGDPFLRWGTYRYIGTKSYTTILGAKKTVPWIKQVK